MAGFVLLVIWSVGFYLLGVWRTHKVWKRKADEMVTAGIVAGRDDAIRYVTG